MKLLLTGAGGYLGGQTAMALTERGHEVICLDRRPRENVYPEGLASRSSLTYVRGDVRDTNLVKHLMRGVDACAHLAFVVGGPACNRNPDLATALAREGTGAVVSAAGNRLVVLASTDAVYSDSVTGHCGEDAAVVAASLYGQLKIEAEEKIRVAKHWAVLRFPSHFGLSVAEGSMRDDLLVHCFVRDIAKVGVLEIAEPETVRTLIEVRDAASALCHALLHRGPVGNGTYNVSSGSWTKKQIGEVVAAVSGGRVRFVERLGSAQGVAKRDFTLDCSRIRSSGWSPTRGLRQGIADLWRYYAARFQDQTPE